MISITGLLSIVFLIVYFLLEWYTQELSHEAKVQKKEEYVPHCDYKIKTNSDGTNDYSELYADAVEERKKAKRAAVEMSSIEGTETESLLSSLQQELNSDDNQPVYTEEEVISYFQEHEPIEPINYEEEVIDPPVVYCEDELPHFQENEPIEPINFQDKINEQEATVRNKATFDVQARIYELRHRLSEFSNEEADMFDIEAMIMAQYELFQLEGREDQVQQLEKDFFMYFPQSSNQSPNEPIPKVYEEDILTLEDMEMEREKPSSKPHKHSTSTISDNILGLQRWRGKVIGKTGDYIHFQDYSRIWIKAGDKINKINLGDDLILEVFRDEEEITLKQMFRVKNKKSQSHLKIVNQ